MRISAAPLMAALLLLSGCSTFDSINPFGSKGPKMAALQPSTETVSARVAWQESIAKSGEYTLVPAIVGETVYAASRKGEVVRIDQGQVTWRINAENILSGGVGAGKNTVVVGTPKGDVLAFDSADGKALWTAKATSEVLSPPAVGQGLVIVRSGDNRLLAYDEMSGQRKWVFQRPTPALSLRSSAQPLISDNYVFAGFPAGKLIAVNLANGVSVWDGTVALPKGSTELERVADVTSAPLIYGNTICAVAYQGRVSCFDLQGGNLIWSREISSDVGLGLDRRNLFVTDEKGSVHAFDLATGASLWKQEQLFLRRVSAPQVLRGYVVVADVEGVVHFLDRENGSIVGRLTTDGTPVRAPLQIMNNLLVLQTSGGKVFAIEIP